MKILINAYAMCPGMGSEQGMAWNWCTSLAKYCELHIITESEYRIQIENGLNSLTPDPSPKGEGRILTETQCQNMHIYYLPVGRDAVECQQIRKMCWNQGDWRFYRYYERWQRKVEKLAEKICAETQIDILHQLNMIGFREPGYLWRVSQKRGIPFVWGPIGGMKQFPMAYAQGGGLKMQGFNWLKNTINTWQIKHDRRVSAALQQASLLISSIPDSYRAIKRYHGLESVIIPETGCFPSTIKKEKNTSNNKPLQVMWVGKFDFRKRLDIALRAIAETKNENIVMHVYGTGNDKQVENAHRLTEELGIQNHVIFHGACPNTEVKTAMREADLFLFTSVSEDTSTVVLEAMSNCLPVLCFDACGMSAVIDDTVGRKIALSTPKQSVSDFAESLQFFYENRMELQTRSEACLARAEELSWDNKARQMVELYRKVSG